MGNMAIVVIIDVKFDRFQFYYFLVRVIGQIKGGKIWVVGKRIFIGEFWQGDMDIVMMVGVGIGESNQLGILNFLFVIFFDVIVGGNGSFGYGEQ